MDFTLFDYLESVYKEIIWVTSVGLLFQLLAYFFPFRKQEKSNEFVWDVAAMVFATFCAILYGYVMGAWLVSTLSSLPIIQNWYAFLADIPLPFLLLGALLFGDFVAYWTHRWMHTTYWGWQQHAWHHTPKHVWWLSGLRGTPIHLVLTFAPHTIGNAIFMSPDVMENTLLLTAAAIVGILNQHTIHSNIRIPFAGLIEKVLVTPRFHFVHHSADIRFTNSNYGFIFTFWDKLFGSYTNPEHVDKDEQLGLDYQASYLKLMLGLPHEHLSPLQEDEGQAVQGISSAKR